MSVIGVSLLCAYFFGLYIYIIKNKLREYCWIVFCATIAISIFINVGSCTKHFSYSEIASMVCIITSVVVKTLQKREGFFIRKSIFFSALLLISILLIGLFNLAVNTNMPYVLGMSTNIDQAFRGNEFASKARISMSNLFALFDMILFMLLLICFRKELADHRKVMQLLDIIRAVFHIFMIVAVIEFAINNTTTPTYLRDAVYSITGEFDPAKTFYPQNRFGYVGITLLFSEQSYISLFLVYDAIVWVQGIRNNKELIFYLLSMIVVVMSGCTTGFMIMPFVLLVFARSILHHDGEKSKFRKIIDFTILLGFSIVAVFLIFSMAEVFLKMIDQSFYKLNALIKGGSVSETSNAFNSAATRNFGNQIAIRAFLQSPLLGVGIGTTRGYGIWTGLLANFGILGITTLLYLIDKVVSFNLKGKKILFIILVAYFSIVLSVWYAYMPAFIPIYLVFSKYAVRSTGGAA